MQKFLSALKSLKVTSNSKSSKIKALEKKCKSIVNYSYRSMAKAIFIFGGCRSGKSSYAVERAKGFARVSYLATSKILDEEMEQRIRRHQQMRPKEWQTVEAPYDLSEAIRQAGSESELIIVDCLTMYLANHFDGHKGLETPNEQELFETWLRTDTRQIMAAVRTASAREVLLISNEVGLGIVPLGAQTRFFRDMCGLMNQWIAAQADEVIKMEVGLATRLK